MKFYKLSGFDNYFISKNGIIKNKNDKIMKTHEENGYIRITLRKNGKKQNYYVHQLLAMTFIKNPNNYSEINHINHKRNDNRLSNLEWCSRKYNNQNKKP